MSLDREKEKTLTGSATYNTPWISVEVPGKLKWSGRWESNPRHKLGKLGYYHYTTPAKVAILCATALGFNHSGKRANVQPRSSTRLNADSQDECEYGILLNSIILFPCCVILIALLKGVGSAEMGLSSYND